MKTLLALILALFAGQSALAANSRLTFSCKTDGGYTIKFQVEQTPSGKIRFLEEQVESQEEIFDISPNNSEIGALNENNGISQNAKTVTFSGDADGYYLADLVLYRNSGLKKGYLKIKDISGMGSGNSYSLVSCKVKEI